MAGQGKLEVFAHFRHSSGVLSFRYALHSESFISVHAKEGGTGASPTSTSSSSPIVAVRSNGPRHCLNLSLPVSFMRRARDLFLRFQNVPSKRALDSCGGQRQEPCERSRIQIGP